MVDFNPDKDIPDLSGKTILVTGGTNGLGKETLFLLAPHSPSKLIFTGRNAAASQKIIKTFQADYPSVDISFIRCDQASLASVQACAREIIATNKRLDIILAVAGILGVPPALTTDGYEMVFGTNHLGHALLIQLLLPLLQATGATPGADPRIVIYSSDAARGLPPKGGIDFNTLRTPQNRYKYAGMWRRYSQSKLANALYARSLAKYYPDILTVSVHPGVAFTPMVKELNLTNRLLVFVSTLQQRKTAREVAYNGVWAATAPRGSGSPKTSPGKVVPGTLYTPVGNMFRTPARTTDDELAERLWKWTEQELAPWMKEATTP